MLTLSYGYKLPVSGDRASTGLFTGLEDNITRLNGHSHNGTDSAFLTAQSIVGVPQTLLAANWVAHGPTGHYRQLVTCFAGFDFDEVQISFRVAGVTGAYIYPTVERVSDTQFYVYTIDNTQDWLVIYGG